MENFLKQELELNKNFNGGGLATNITGKFESNRHAIARIEKYTFGEVAKELKKKKNGGFNISASEMLNIYWTLFGEPEWHHAGKLPKQYGGGMKKTYFLDRVPTAEEFSKWLKDYEEQIKKAEKRRDEEKIKAEKRKKYAEKHATKFTHEKEIPKFGIVESEEMQGKYGWFYADYKYNLPIYYSGIVFKSKKTYETYLKM